MRHLFTVALVFAGLSSTALADFYGPGYGRPPNYQDPGQQVLIQVTCQSLQHQTTSCPVDGFIQQVRLRRQLSRAACNIGSGFTYDRSNIYVMAGCRADFDVLVYQRQGDHGGGRYPYYPPPPQDIQCGSSGYRYNSCTVNGYIEHIELIRQNSNSTCREGDSYGAQTDRVWVDKGCNGTFRVYFR